MWRARSPATTRPSDTFSFSGTFADALGTTAGAFYLRGLDRGVGTEGFVSGSPSGGQRMKFDAAVFLRPDGMARVITFVGSVGHGRRTGGWYPALSPAAARLRAPAADRLAQTPPRRRSARQSTP
jgi:hypothetical protein